MMQITGLGDKREPPGIDEFEHATDLLAFTVDIDQCLGWCSILKAVRVCRPRSRLSIARSAGATHQIAALHPQFE